MRRVVMDEHLTMLIGPASNGALLEIGVLASTGTTQSSSMPCRCGRSSTGSSGEEVIIMRHTDDEIERAAHRFEQLADELDPATAEVDHTDDLREIVAAAEAARADEARLREAVEVARAHGRSWNQIAVALGVSRQAARQRFVDKLHA
jgi:crotonobetainyl-CoA:carnitine CoA-transferase CaiB-like acyl-CoA transferase